VIDCDQTIGALMAMLKSGLRSRDIMTREAFENSVRVVFAVGGSTNAFLHLLALAHEVLYYSPPPPTYLLPPPCTPPPLLSSPLRGLREWCEVNRSTLRVPGVCLAGGGSADDPRDRRAGEARPTAGKHAAAWTLPHVRP
jgi:hypothetical protein